jgi:RND family efflux transporter MFP subunit
MEKISKPKMQKGKKKIFTIIGVVVVLALIGGIVRGAIVSRANQAAQLNVEKKVPVEIMSVTRGQVQTATRVTGEINPEQQVTVTSKGAGKILRVNVKSGDRVSKGTLLAELEGIEVGLQVEQARNGLDTARTAYDNLLTNKERMDYLYQEGIIAQKDWEDFNLQVKNTESQLRQLEITLALAETQRDNLRITAPIDGVVTSVSIEAGNNLAPGVPAMTIADLGRVYAQANVSEKLINRFKVGDEVNVSVKALEDATFVGQVDSIDLTPNQTRLYPVKVLLENSDNLLKPGMFAQVELKNETREDVIAVPVGAVIDTRSEQFVFVATEGKAVKKLVELGLSDGKNVEIIEGLAEGEELVVVGQNFLNDGDWIEVRNRGEAQ